MLTMIRSLFARPRTYRYQIWSTGGGGYLAQADTIEACQQWIRITRRYDVYVTSTRTGAVVMNVLRHP